MNGQNCINNLYFGSAQAKNQLNILDKYLGFVSQKQKGYFLNALSLKMINGDYRTKVNRKKCRSKPYGHT